jgi:hypothetical protein
MILEEYINNLQELVKAKPHTKQLPVYYSIDEEVYDFQPVECKPCVMFNGIDGEVFDLNEVTSDTVGITIVVVN